MKNNSKSDDWLPVLLWALDLFMNPKPARILGSVESWDYRNRLRPDLKQLRRSGMFRRQRKGKRSHWRLTEKGRLAVCDGIDPFARWSRPWDGRLRFLMFDLPRHEKRRRSTLRRSLKRHRFGRLQYSVWITPDAVNERNFPWHHIGLPPDSLTVVEGSPAFPATNRNVVLNAWDFSEINRRYAAAIEVIAAGPKHVRNGSAAERRKWMTEERLAWMNAVTEDPFLPEALLPEDYLGRKAWHERQTMFSQLGNSLLEGNKN